MTTRRWSIFGILGAFLLSISAGLISVSPASASVKGRRNTAIGLTGAAAYELLRGKTGPGLLLGGGAVYAWKRANDEKKAEREHRYSYYRRHRTARYSTRHHRYAYRR